MWFVVVGCVFCCVGCDEWCVGCGCCWWCVDDDVDFDFVCDDLCGVVWFY